MNAKQQHTPLISNDEYPMDALRRLYRDRHDQCDFAIVRDELLHRGHVVTALRAENARLREALQAVVDGIDYERGAASWVNPTELLLQTRAALKGAE